MPRSHAPGGVEGGLGWTNTVPTRVRAKEGWCLVPEHLPPYPKPHGARGETGVRRSCFVKSLTRSHGVRPRQVLSLSP